MAKELLSAEETTARVVLVGVLVVGAVVAMWWYASNHGLDVLLPISGG